MELRFAFEEWRLFLLAALLWVPAGGALGTRVGRRTHRITLGTRIGRRTARITLRTAVGRRTHRITLGTRIKRRTHRISLRPGLGRRTHRITLGTRIKRRAGRISLRPGLGGRAGRISGGPAKDLSHPCHHLAAHPVGGIQGVVQVSDQGTDLGGLGVRAISGVFKPRCSCAERRPSVIAVRVSLDYR